MNKHLYLCPLLVLSSPTLMMHGHTNLTFNTILFPNDDISKTAKYTSSVQCVTYRQDLFQHTEQIIPHISYSSMFRLPYVAIIKENTQILFLGTNI